MSFQIESAAPSFYGATVRAFQNLQTDLHGLRVKKFVKLLQESTLLTDLLIEANVNEMSISVKDINIVFVRCGEWFKVSIGDQSYLIKDHVIYDLDQSPVHPAMLTPRIIRPLISQCAA